jgi:hypothetical protein
MCYYNLKDFLSTQQLEVNMSPYLPIEAFEEDGVTRTPDFGYVASRETVFEAAAEANQSDVVLSELCDPIGEAFLGIKPFPDPQQRAYGIQGLLTKVKAMPEGGTIIVATPLGEAAWTAIKAIWGVSSVVMLDETTFGITISIAFAWESIQDEKLGSIHQQVVTILQSLITLHPEPEAIDDAEEGAPVPDPQASVVHRITATQVPQDEPSGETIVITSAFPDTPPPEDEPPVHA